MSIDPQSVENKGESDPTLWSSREFGCESIHAAVALGEFFQAVTVTIFSFEQLLSRNLLPGMNFWKLRILLRDTACLEVIIVSSIFPALLFLQDKLLEWVWKLLIPVKSLKNYWAHPFQN